MTDMPATPRFALPLLAVAQAQKEITHNEAVTLLDALVHAAVEAGPLAVPPAGPIEGQCWIVDAAPTGAWAGQCDRALDRGWLAICGAARTHGGHAPDRWCAASFRWGRVGRAGIDRSTHRRVDNRFRGA